MKDKKKAESDEKKKQAREQIVRIQQEAGLGGTPKKGSKKKTGKDGKKVAPKVRQATSKKSTR